MTGVRQPDVQDATVRKREPAHTLTPAAGSTTCPFKMDASALLAPAHAAATLFMAGLIWFVQVVHYPLFRRLGPTDAAGYAQEHARRTGWVVGPMMLAELVLGLTLAARGGPAAWVALALLGVIWASTAWIQVPLHRRLAVAPDPAAVERLVRTNWIRTGAWTLRAPLALALAAG